MTVEELAEESKRFRERTEVSHDNTQLALLPHRQLRRVNVQTLHVTQQRLSARVKRATSLSQGYPITAAIQQLQGELVLELANRGKYGRMRAVQVVRSALKTPRTRHGVEALQFVQGEAL